MRLLLSINNPSAEIFQRRGFALNIYILIDEKIGEGDVVNDLIDCVIYLFPNANGGAFAVFGATAFLVFLYACNGGETALGEPEDHTNRIFLGTFRKPVAAA